MRDQFTNLIITEIKNFNYNTERFFNTSFSNFQTIEDYYASKQKTADDCINTLKNLTDLFSEEKYKEDRDV